MCFLKAGAQKKTGALSTYASGKVDADTTFFSLLILIKQLHLFNLPADDLAQGHKKTIIAFTITVFSFFLGEQWVSNPRPSEPQSDALTN